MKSKFDEKKPCPLCGKLLSPSHTEYEVKYYCDCIGYSRPVIGIQKEKEGVEQNDSSN